ncbi:TPA: hypothetical protein ACRTNY_000203 [Aeromonas hydrophila]
MTIQKSRFSSEAALQPAGSQDEAGLAGMMDSIHRTASTFRRLPNFAIGLSDNVRHGTIPPVATLSKWRHGWRIKHPQAVTKPRTIRTSSPVSGSLPGIYSVLGAWVGSQRKRPHCAFLGLALLCGYPIRLGLSKPRIHTMIFTFLIASSACRLADLRRIRIVSALADNEAQARAALAGLPLVFLSRTPTGRAAA